MRAFEGQVTRAGADRALESLTKAVVLLWEGIL